MTTRNFYTGFCSALALVVAAAPALAVNEEGGTPLWAAEETQDTQSTPVSEGEGTPTTVGQATQAPIEPPKALDVFQERSALTTPGYLVVEPSVEFTQTSSSRAQIQGFTVIPAVLIGSIDVSEIRNQAVTTAMTFRYGVTPRLEVETRIPFVHRDEESRTRQLLTGSNFDAFVNSDGSGLGDVEAAIHYQLTTGLGKLPLLIGNLRVKSDTGEGPFDVDRETLRQPSDPAHPTVPGPVIGTVLSEQPTGSGFWAVEPSISAIIPSDPAVFFGNISYTANLEKDTGATGKIDPGDFVGFNFGMGFALNERASFSLGYDHNIIMKSKGFSGFDNQFSTLHIGSLLVGLAYRITPRFNVNLSLGVGVTDDSPDVSLTLRTPLRTNLRKVAQSSNP